MLEKNLEAIKRYNPELAGRIADHTFNNIEIVETPSGDYNLIYCGLPIHNFDDPQKEASEIFGDDDKNNETSLRLIFGLGLGYLFKRTFIGSNGIIVIYEPVMDILRATLELVDFSSELSDSRVVVIDDLNSLVTLFSTRIIEKVNILFLDSYKLMLPEQFEQVYSQLNKLFVDQHTNLTSSLELAETFVRNIPGMIQYPSASVLKDYALNKPVLVVSAGPSLDKTIDLIRSNREKLVIISVGQALSALYAAGINPDFVVMIDRLAIEDQLSCIGKGTSSLNLVLDTAACPKVYLESTDTKFIYFSELDYMSKWVASKLDNPVLPSGSTVSVTAFNLAILLGGNPVILTGQDLAYSGGKLYASNTLYEDLALTDDAKVIISSPIDDETSLKSHKDAFSEKILAKNIHHYEKIIKVKGQNGDELSTSPGYASFIALYNSLTKDIKSKKPHLRLINCSVGGAYIDGFEHIPFNEVVNQLKPVNYDGMQSVKSLFEANLPDESSKKLLIDAFNCLLNDLKSVKIISQQVVDQSARILKEVKNSRTVTIKAVKSSQKLQNLYNELLQYNSGDRISFIYPFIQRELLEYHSLQHKTFNNDTEKFVNAVNSINAFANALLIGVNRAFISFEKLESIGIRRD